MAVLWLSLHPMVPQALLPSHDYLILLIVTDELTRCHDVISPVHGSLLSPVAMTAALSSPHLLHVGGCHCETLCVRTPHPVNR